MSPKNSSLAHDEIIFEEQYQPQLNLIINVRKGINNDALLPNLAAEIEQVVSISGKVTVSF